MTIKKFLVTGLGAAVTEAGVRAWLEGFGPVVKVAIIRDGNAADPIVLVEMAIGDGAAAHLVSRVTNYWHEGAMVNVRLLIH